jgi:hypothetical protein
MLFSNPASVGVNRLLKECAGFEAFPIQANTEMEALFLVREALVLIRPENKRPG